MCYFFRYPIVTRRDVRSSSKSVCGSQFHLHQKNTSRCRSEHLAPYDVQQRERLRVVYATYADNGRAWYRVSLRKSLQPSFLDDDGTEWNLRIWHRIRVGITDTSDIAVNSQYIRHCQGLRANSDSHVDKFRRKSWPLVAE